MGKLCALDPNLENPQDDKLHAESQFLEPLYDLIDNAIQPPFAISIDGLWGTGKTTKMRLLQTKLELRGYPTFWFNPWKYSQGQDVLLAFLRSLAAKHKPRLQEMGKSAGQMFKVLLKVGAGTTLNVLTGGQVALDDVKTAFKAAESDAPWEDFLDMVKTIEHEFVQLVNAVNVHHAKKKDLPEPKPLIIFLDDLDRCLPGEAIQLLEALKNLFITKSCQVVFVCGIDTRVAKKFIQRHYDVDETFAINYFRKIFNLTVPMPYNPGMQEFLIIYIRQLFEWDAAGGEQSSTMARMVADKGEEAGIVSVRKFLNIVHNVFTFWRFYRQTYTFTLQPQNALDPVVLLLIVKEAWQPVYELMVQRALQPSRPPLSDVVESLQQEKHLEAGVQEDFLLRYFDDAAPFGDIELAEMLTTYPLLG